MGEDKYPEYKKQLDRLNSFKNVQCSLTSPTALSDLGYFYLEQRNEVVCYSCGFSLNEWVVSHHWPYFQHAEKSQDCRLLQSPIHEKKFIQDLVKIFNSEEFNLHRNYEKRLNSFQNWPLVYIDKEDLAKNGFFYLNVKDWVQCEFCNLQLRCWEEGEIPYEEHKKIDDNCWGIVYNETKATVDKMKNEFPDVTDNLIARRNSFTQWPFNIKIETLIDYGFLFKNETIECFSCGVSVENLNKYIEDYTAKYGSKYLDTLPEYIHYAQYGAFPKCRYLIDKNYAIKFKNKIMSTLNIRSFLDNIGSNDNPLEALKDRTSRNSSYAFWSNLQVSPLEIREAAFFYVGIGDVVECPYCITLINNFKKDDPSPLERHKREFPDCEFIKMYFNDTKQESSKNEVPSEKETNVKVGFKINPLKGEFGGNFEFLRKTFRGKKKKKENKDN